MTASTIDERLATLGIKLPTPPEPHANYVYAVEVNGLAFFCGAVPRRSDGSLLVGKVGRELSVAEGYDAARLCAIDWLAMAKYSLGSLDRVRRIVRVFGMVNCVPEFGDPGKVINGFSDLLVQIYGEAGRHARSSVGVSSLGGGKAAEIECVVHVDAPV